MELGAVDVLSKKSSRSSKSILTESWDFVARYVFRNIDEAQLSRFVSCLHWESSTSI